MSVEKSIKRYTHDAAEGPGPGQGSHSHLTPGEARPGFLRMRRVCLLMPGHAPNSAPAPASCCDICWCPRSSMVTQPCVSSLKHRNYETNVNITRGQTGLRDGKSFQGNFYQFNFSKKEYIMCRRVWYWPILFFRIWIIPFNIVLWTLVQEHE